MYRKFLSMLLTIALFYPVAGNSNNLLKNLNQTEVTDTFVVCGNCYTCKVRIHGELQKLEGISAANWDYSEQLEITYDRTIISPIEFLQAIAGVGHDTEKIRATDFAYNSLVGTCCEYDRWLTYEQMEGTWEVKGKEDCKENIDSVLFDLHGIVSGSWENNVLSTSFYKQITDSDQILMKMAEAGYDNELYVASDEAYEMLSETCKYRTALVDTTDTTDTLSFVTNKKIEILNIYPNPINDRIYLKNDLKNITSIKIINTSGQEIQHMNSNDHNLKSGIDVYYLSNGIYILKIESTESIYSSKFIKN